MFSPVSNSLRTTVISVARSSRLIEAVDHPVGFEGDAELEVLVGGGHASRSSWCGRSQVVPLKLAPVVLQRLGDLRVGGRALEDHVLEQVGHAGFAVALVPRADEHGQVDGDLGRERIGEEQHAQAVVEPVFGDPLDRRDVPRYRATAFAALLRCRSLMLPGSASSNEE